MFAMWVARSGVELQGVDAALRSARDAGVAHLEEIAEREAPALGLTQPQCLSYLRNNLHFYLGDEEQSGLALFYQKASGLQLAPAGAELEFYDCHTT